MMPDTQHNSSPLPDKTAYFNPDYLLPHRFIAYACQYNEIVRLAPKTVLEIGIGNGLLAHILKQSGLQVTTLDINPCLQPDVVASVTDIPLPDNTFDLTVCCEVLEHLPFSQFPTALRQIHRVTRNHVVLSLPDSRKALSIHIPLIARKKIIPLPLPRPIRPLFEDEHQWEINIKGHDIKKITQIMKDCGLPLLKTYRIWDLPYHRLIVTSVK